MNDKELADRIVALGVGEYRGDDRYLIAPPTDNVRERGFQIVHRADDGLAKWFVRDWRVVGALMERVKSAGHQIESIDDNVRVVRRGYQFFNLDALFGKSSNESLPRAICEACVAALEGGDE